MQDKKNGTSRPSETDWFWHHVIVPLLSSPKVETPLPALVLTIDNIKLLLDEIPVYWQHDIAVLLDVHRIIGDGIRNDRTIRLDLVLKYYLITPSSPQTAVQWTAVLDSLKELRAAHVLGHDGQLSDLDLIMDDQDDKCIVEVIHQTHAEQKKSLINYLAMHFFTVELEQQITGTPTVVLERLVNTENSLALGRRLVKALDWYGSKEGEVCPQPVLAKLVWRALWLSVAAPPTHPQCLYSTYDIAKFTGQGVSYSFIRNDIVKDLMGRLDIFAPVARLVMRIIEANTSSELWIRDIPDDLIYTGSSTWVNFRSGFLLAEAMACGSSRHMTFEQLLNLPAEHSRAASPEHQMLVAASRLAPAVQWAVGNGVLAIKHQGYSAEEVEQAITVLEEHERDLTEAVQNLVLTPPGRWRFSSDEAFEKAYHSFLETPKAAYKTLIKGLLTQLSSLYRHSIANGEVRVYSLREALPHTQFEHENKSNTDAVRGRAGFIIETVFHNKKYYMEVFPGVGVVRAREDIRDLLIGGSVEVRSTGSTSRPSKATFRFGTELGFDWQAYKHGSKPKEGSSAVLIAEQVGRTLPSIIETPRKESFDTNLLHSRRSEDLAEMVSRELFYRDEQALLEQTRQNTQELDLGQTALDELSFWGKMVVPVWGAIDDLSSGDPERIEQGGLSLFTDIVSFGLPIGKYISGCARLAVQAGKVGIRVVLPRFSVLTKQLVISTLQEFNPLDGPLTLLKLGGTVSLKVGRAGARQLNRGITQLSKWSMNIASPGTTRHLLSVNPTTWTPLRTGDQLSKVDGIDNVPVRSTGNLASRDYRLIDSSTDQVFGPSYLAPKTAISNVIYRHYAAPALCIAGLKPNSKGIYRSVDGQRHYICNIDEVGNIAAYQIRNDFDLNADAVSVNIVNYKTNRQTELQVWSTDSGQWQKIGLSGGAPGEYNLITDKHLVEWKQLNDSVEEMAVRQFTDKYRLDPQEFRQYAQLSLGLTNEGQQVLRRARNVQTAITDKHLRHWQAQSQQGRDRLTQEGFANRHNLNLASFMEHIDQYGKLKAAGKVLMKHAKGEEFTTITYEHLEAWQALYKSRDNTLTASDFAEQNSLNPVRWGTYVGETGDLTKSGKELLVFGDPTPMPQLARKSSAGRDISESTKRPAEEITPGSSKRPRPDLEAGPHLAHDIDNSLPILQNPKNVKESLTLTAEGSSGLKGRASTADEIVVTYWNQLLDDVTPKTARLKLHEKITRDVQDWIRNENNLASRLDKLMETKVLSNGPERGRSVVAKRDIKRFEVLGPYSGKLHFGSKTLLEEISDKGHKAVNSYAFSTFSNDGTISAHGSGNILSLINSPNAPGRPSLGRDNVASINVGRYMTFFVAWQDIKKGDELLLDYGDGYDWT